jgi:hypothetical protein
MSVPVMCWGARLVIAETAVQDGGNFRNSTVGNEPELWPTIGRIRGQYFPPIVVAPAFNSPGALGRVKGSLAALAAVAPLTRPARSRVVGNYRSDECGGDLVARPPDPVSKWSDASSAWEHR